MSYKGVKLAAYYNISSAHKNRRRSVGILRRLGSDCRPHPGNRESRTGSDSRITRISCPTYASAIRVPKIASPHFGYATKLLIKLKAFYGSPQGNRICGRVKNTSIYGKIFLFILTVRLAACHYAILFVCDYYWQPPTQEKSKN